MKAMKKGETHIDDYIFIVQILFCLIVIVIFFKHMDIQIYNIFHALMVALVFILFLLGTGYTTCRSNSKNTFNYLLIVILDFLCIMFLFLGSGYFELRLLFLIPIIVSAIKFNLAVNIAISVSVGAINLIMDLLFSDKLPGNYSIETDLMFIVLYVMISWLVGYFVKIEKNISFNLYQTKEYLMQQSSLLEKLINEIPLCIAVINKEEKIVHLNQVALDFAGIRDKSPQEFVGLHYKEYTDILFNNNYNYQDLLILDTLHNGKSYFKEQGIRNNMIIEGIYQPIYDSEDNIIYAMGIFYDITSEELFNERLRNLERMTLVGQMGASIAHEIKNPLTTIKGFLQLAERSDQKLSQAELKLLISEIERCNIIISDFLSISKKSDTKLKISNLKEILEQQIVLVEKEAMMANVQLSIEIDEIWLKVNANEIKQLFLNLAQNGIEAMPEGGSLHIRLKEIDNKVVLEIEDVGKGISPDILERIGTPFFTTKEKGTGLGISVCQQIVEKHGAELEIKSEVGVGTKVRVIFPKVNQSEPMVIPSK